MVWRGWAGAGLFIALAAWARLSWGYWTPFSIVALIGVPVVFCAVLWKLWRAAAKTLELWQVQAPNRVMRIELDDDGFQVLLGKSENRFEWQKIRRLWRYDDVWMLEIVRMRSVFFPPEHVDQDTLDFIVERCQHFGVVVKP